MNPILLVDNGSTSVHSWAALSCLAHGLRDRLGEEVLPTSLGHLPDLEEARARGLPTPKLFSQRLAELSGEVRVQPYFLGPSFAVRRRIPRDFAAAQEENPDLELRLGEVLAPAPEKTPALAQLMVAEVQALLEAKGWTRPSVVLVDHGSPRPEVTAIRDQVAQHLAQGLGEAVEEVIASSMERRPGEEYAFNDPLLEVALTELRSEAVVLVPFFLSPGRHAGEGGDVDQIVAAHLPPQKTLVRTPLLGELAGLIDVLEERAKGLRASS